ncbi:adenylate/guanylate cyclase domain-containing protein [Chryseobacterium carnipullorum]|nr:adenylate/guanylate cyclase domain-containing protein [Chryseobacterium carnipullorum]AZA64549.1 adenylate/guanylate cyclase domain-containing protein [Chryseobacterium carnipullorum]
MYGAFEGINSLGTSFAKIPDQNSMSSLVSLFENINNPISTFQNNLRSTNFEKQIKLEEEINKIKSKLSLTLKELNEEKDKSKKTDELQTLLDQLNSKEKINHIIPRIHEEAQEKLFSDENFRSNFDNGKDYYSIVVSIDIRRSTELMLKARKPELFSKFITELSKKLSQIIINNYGIFDKFTGDGILAFFPKFYSGENAIIRSLKAAEECHLAFKQHYDISRDCFNVFIKDVGLGIGIDYGNVTLVNTSNELTVVGIPVVYACRMSGANAGETLLNQPAKEELLTHCTKNLKISETEIQIKNEGTALAYKAEFISEITLNDDFVWKNDENKPTTSKDEKIDKTT